MIRFIEVNGAFINTDTIKTCYQDMEKYLHIEFTDGTKEFISLSHAVNAMVQLSGRDHILQIIPAAVPLYAVYEDEQPGTYFTVAVHYLALCADGEIRGAECCDGWFECISIEHGNCRGLYPADQLDQFPGIEIVGEEARQ